MPNFSRFKPQREVRSTRSSAAAANGELLVQAWTMRGSTLNAVRGQLKYALRPTAPPAAPGTPEQPSRSASPSTVREKSAKPQPEKRRKANLTASPAKSPANTQQKLPTGWREEVRVPQSGRKYRVYVGPRKGQYAESRAKAWEVRACACCVLSPRPRVCAVVPRVLLASF
jgi:hypothetical protein